MVDWHILMITGLFILADIVTGFLAACKNKCVKSEKMREGLWHKAGFIGIVALACLCEYSMVYIDLGIEVPLVVPVCGIIVWIELMSNWENLCKLSPELASTKISGLFNIDGGDRK